MLPALRAVTAAVLAVVLSGGAVMAQALTAAGAACPSSSQHCQQTQLACVCCLDNSPVPATPSTDRTSIAKQVQAATSHIAAPPAGVVLLPASVRAVSTHRAGPPLSLSILHVSLLI